MTPLSVNDVLARVRELPALPALVIELIDSLDKESTSAEQLADKISNDQALVAKTLRLANSSFYGMSREITSVADAATVLGLRTIRNIAIAAVLAEHFGRGDGELDFDAFWRHSLATALCSAAIARETGFDEGMAFTLGLLHDVGRLVLASAFAEQFSQVVAHQRAHDCPSLDAERAVLGTDHAAIGRLITEQWRFSPGLVAAIAGHHEPPDAADAKASLSDLVHVADNIAHALDLSRLEEDAVPLLSMTAWTRLGLDEAACQRVFEQTRAPHDALCAALFG